MITVQSNIQQKKQTKTNKRYEFEIEISPYDIYLFIDEYSENKHSRLVYEKGLTFNFKNIFMEQPKKTKALFFEIEIFSNLFAVVLIVGR